MLAIKRIPPLVLTNLKGEKNQFNELIACNAVIKQQMKSNAVCNYMEGNLNTFEYPKVWNSSLNLLFPKVLFASYVLKRLTAT